MATAIIKIYKWKVSRVVGDESKWVPLKTIEEPVIKITEKRVHTRNHKFDRATGDDIVKREYRIHSWYQYKLLEIKQ